MLVRILDHHHRRIDHRANGDGDAAQRHDVSVHALVAHDQERCQHAERQRDNGHQSRAQVKQEHQAHQRHHNEFLNELGRQVVHRAIYQR
ncbi:hypothetical protein D9M69_730210 [compost metagenome]